MAALAKPSRLLWLSLGLLIALLAYHAVGVVQDFAASIVSPVEGDYGEGIVWQQAALIPGPRAYSPSVALPFIVFHYPPLYHLIVRAVAGSDPNLLPVGRLVSAIAAVSLAPLVAGLVLICVTPPGRRVGWPELVPALTAGLLVLCLHAVRTWGMYMRVDMMALALNLAGLVIGLMAAGRFWNTLAGLLLCVAAVYTKQTSLMPGVALFIVAAIRNPLGAIPAAIIAGAIGLGALRWLQSVTDGGFWLNIVSYNQNRFALRHAYWVFWPERSGAPFMLLMLVAALATALPLASHGDARTAWLALRRANRSQASQAGLLLCFGLSSALLPITAFKSGGNYNYLLEWLSLGCVLVGVLIHLLAFDRYGSRWIYAVTAAMILTASALPFREMDKDFDPVRLANQRRLVARIASAQKPVLSENMTVLMQAGKPVVVEPAIVTELAERGQWDDRPLVAEIRSHAFAFIATSDTAGRRTEQVDAAMREAYPRVEQVDDRLWLHLPPD